MKTPYIFASQRGFTLVELMIATLLGVLVTGGVIQIFISAKQAYRLQENLSRLQENGRMAMDRMSFDIRMAGYADYSCVPVSTIQQAFDLANDRIPSTSRTPSDWCKDRSCTDANTANTTNNIRLDVVRSYQWTNATATACPPAPACSPVTTPPANTCAPANASASVNGTTPTNAKEISYFIRSDTSATNINAVPSLWKYDSSQLTAALRTQELIEDVEDMKVFYGIDTDMPADNIPNYYADAANMTETIDAKTAWFRVVSVRISLLAVTSDIGLTDSAQAFTFNGVNYPGYTGADPQNCSTTSTPACVCTYNGTIVAVAPLGSTTSPTCNSPNTLVPDTRLRRVFTTTIAVRNRLP